MTGLLLLATAACCAGAVFTAAAELLGRRAARTSLRRVVAYAPGAGATVADEAPRRKGASAEAVAKVVLRLTPGATRESVASMLHVAGMSKRISVDAYLALKGAIAGVGVLLGLLVTFSHAALGVAVMALGAALGLALPDASMRRRMHERRELILDELPNALDLIAISVEAGLGADAAMARYADRATTPLADELGLIVAQLRVGGRRQDVLRTFATRVPAPEVQAFVRGILHSDQLGTALTRTLRMQSADVRARRQLHAEETANKAPVRMLFPTIFCIFPALFVIVLGPAVIQLFHAL
jgi:tight adherence protein C